MATTRIAVVTGAGTGIGRSAALALARAGWSVALAGRRPAPLAEVAAEGEALGAAMLAQPTDVRDPASVEALFAATKARFGRLDLLFNNAGIGGRAVPLEDMAVEDWRKVVDSNLTGPFLCTQQAFRMMKNQDPRGGRIINNGSLSAHVPRPNAAAYTATKHAITGLTRAAALDGRKYGIACGQIDIGNAATPMTRRMDEGMPQADGSVRPEPTMNVAHVGDAIVQMASLPLDANVLFMTIMATAMPYVGRG